jgi:hypothetical protein
MRLLLADAVLLLHAGFVLFVIAGQFAIMIGGWRHWRWARNPWFRYAHLTAISYVVAEAWFGITCPLTLLEDTLRTRAGGAGYETGFVADWLHRLLFYSAPEWVFTWVYSLFFALVITSWWLWPPRRGGAP